MTSSINPNNINGAYPVAGQDNNSQGFRDNFTNTKTNFQYAADEITDLQNKVVLKQALTGTTLDNDMLGSVLSNAQLQDMSETRVALTVSGSGTLSVPINYAAGSYQTVATPNSGSGTLQLSFTNWPASGALGSVTVQVEVTNTNFTLTLPAAVTNGTTGIQGISGQVITFATTGTFNFRFISDTGGSAITVFDLNRPLFFYTNAVTIDSNLTVTGYVALNGNEDLADGAAASITETTSYFSTGASGETATLAAGVTGQIKTLIMAGDGGGDMVITVTNAGWKTSGTGTITFSAIGQSCTLQYVNSKWYMIGAGIGDGNSFVQVA